jgi:hypothetical protein
MVTNAEVACGECADDPDTWQTGYVDTVCGFGMFRPETHERICRRIAGLLARKLR